MDTAIPDFKAGPVFHANYNSTADVVIDQGGTDSGKTVAIMQVLLVLATTTKAPQMDGVMTVLNESVPNSKKGAYRILQWLVNDNAFVKSKLVEWNKSDRILYFNTGWVMEFLGATDEQSAKQGKRQYLFVNEAQGISWPIFWQMAKRTRIRTFIDYNPSAPFWAHEKLIGTTREGNDLSATVQLIISDHRHNPFLPEQDHAKTEGIKDPELWKVYARGLTGNLQGIIFPNWREIETKDFPFEEEKRFGGLDFGYTNDPTAGVDIRRIANKIFLHELCYEPGMTPSQIKTLYTSRGYQRDPIYCEHDGDMIRQLRKLGLNAISARKGPGSIKAGILKFSEYEVYYTAASKNIDTERKSYMYEIDADTGKPTNDPIDLNNHLMDASRYGVYTHFYRKAA